MNTLYFSEYFAGVYHVSLWQSINCWYEREMRRRMGSAQYGLRRAKKRIKLEISNQMHKKLSQQTGTALEHQTSSCFSKKKKSCNECQGPSMWLGAWAAIQLRKNAAAVATRPVGDAVSDLTGLGIEP